MSKTLYLIRGIPGSGKSTFAQRLLIADIVQEYCEADDYFTSIDGKYEFDPTKLSEAHQYCQNLTRMILSRGNSIAVSNTSCAEWEVEIYQNIAAEYDARFVSIIVENRHGNKNIHGCSDEKVERMKRKFDVKL